MDLPTIIGMSQMAGMDENTIESMKTFIEPCVDIKNPDEYVILRIYLSIYVTIDAT